MELDAKTINKQIRATIYPILRERGFTKVGATYSFAHPTDDVVHRLHIERFSNHHRDVMGFAKFTMSAHLMTYYVQEILDPIDTCGHVSLTKSVSADGLLQVSKNVHMKGFRQQLIKTIDQAEGVPPGDRRPRHGNWLMLEQTPAYSQLIVDDIADQIAENFDTYHAPLADVRTTLEQLLAEDGDPIYSGPTRRLDESGTAVDIGEDSGVPVDAWNGSSAQPRRWEMPTSCSSTSRSGLHSQRRSAPSRAEPGGFATRRFRGIRR